MGVIRVEKTENYTVMSNYHLKDRNLSLKSQGLLSIILSLPENWDYSVAGLVSIVKDGKSAVQTALKELEENNYVVRRRIKDDKGRIVDWEYIIFENPNENNIPIDEKKSINSPLTDFQDVGNRDVDFQDVDVVSQLNTNKLNTNKLNTKEKAPAEPTLSSTKSRKRDLISRSKATLVDDLESGKDIAEQKKAKKKSPKELFRDECLEIIEHEYSDSTADLLTDYFNFISDPKQADSDNKMKVVKTVSTWRKKLDRLEELVNEGYDCEKLIKQSLRNKNYVFYPLESVDKNSQYNSQNNKFETCDVFPTMMTHEEILAEKRRLIDAGAKIY